MGKHIRLVGFSLAISLLWGAWAPPTNAQTTSHWKVAVDGSFGAASNWSNGVPGVNDTAYFNPSGITPYTVFFAAPIVPQQYQVQQAGIFSNVTFAQSGGHSKPASFAASRSIDVGGGQLTTELPVSTAAASIFGVIPSAAELNVDGAPFTVTGNDQGTGDSTVYALELGPQNVFANGPGLLTINNGGQLELTASGASVGIASCHSGTTDASEIDVDGASSKLALDGGGPLRVGDSGPGTLKITNGGQVDDNIGLLGPNSYFSGSTGGYGQAIVQGATSLWANRDYLNIGVPTAATPSSLTLVAGGTVTVTYQLFVTTQGRIFGSGSITAGSVLNEALIAPGSDFANLHFAGVLRLTTNFIQTSTGTLLVQLAGTTAGTQYDQILISGTSLLTGNLNVVLADNFVPAAGNSFHILDLGTVTGAFGNVNLPALAAGLSWNTSQLYTAGVISVNGPPVPGDYNGNGIVDAADYTVWRDHLGQTFALPNRSAGNSGPIGAADYDFWKANFGNHAGSGSGAAAAVPEPATLWMLLAGILTMCVRGRPKVS